MSHFDAEEETVVGRLAEAATGRTLAEDYALVIRDRMPGCRGHLAFAAEGNPFEGPGTYHLVASDGRRIVFNLVEGDVEAWEGIILSDEPAPGE